MSNKTKILIVSGVTGIGKSDLALKIANLLKTDIIVGDSLQIYKNFPIASNFPNLAEGSKLPKYHFLGNFDVLKERIGAFQYKRLLKPKIEEIVQERKIPLIEGGCGFYLHYAFSSGDACVEDEVLQSAGAKAREIIENQYEKNWKKAEQYLISLCPKAQNFVANNDFYRLEKALKYAIASNGEFFSARDEGDQGKLREIYDIRGIFLTKYEMDIYKDIHKRCDLMVERGFIEEVYEFCRSLNSLDFKNYSDLPIPLGYQEAANFIKEIQEIIDNKFYNRLKKNRLINQAFLQFCAEFQTKSRQYAHYQVKFARKRFDNFLWIDYSQPNEKLIKKITDIYHLSKEDFDKLVSSSENINLIKTHSDPKVHKLIKSTPLQLNYEKAFTTIREGILKKLQYDVMGPVVEY